VFKGAPHCPAAAASHVNATTHDTTDNTQLMQGPLTLESTLYGESDSTWPTWQQQGAPLVVVPQGIQCFGYTPTALLLLPRRMTR
jgi:hypothetical protein